MLMSFVGAILPAWGYHLSDDYVEVGRYFLALAMGLLLSVKAGALLTRARELRFAVVTGCGLGSAGLVWLALSSPPVAWEWRAAGVLLLGLSAGLLNNAAFRGISSVYELDPASTVNLAGVLFGMGCLLMAVMVSSAFYVYTVTSTLLLVAAIPAFAAGLYARTTLGQPVAYGGRDWRQIWEEVKSPGAVLFTLLLFFQFGNEWTIAGWLTIYLVQTVGVSPDDAILMLAVFWLALLVGRGVAQALLPRVGHGKLLTGSSMSALLGCLILASTNNRLGGWTAILLVGGGFAMIYPLVVEKIGHRFPDYHPGFFNGLMSYGIGGGLLAPWVLGYLSNLWGIRAVMLVPFAGTIIVFVLIVLIWVENRLTAASPSR
jgi:fucose permease